MDCNSSKKKKQKKTNSSMACLLKNLNLLYFEKNMACNISNTLGAVIKNTTQWPVTLQNILPVTPHFKTFNNAKAL